MIRLVYLRDNSLYGSFNSVYLEQSIVHLTSEPISVDEVAKYGFGIEFSQHIVSQPAVYDFRTELGRFYHTDRPYQYSKKEVLLAIRAYAQSELKP